MLPLSCLWYVDFLTVFDFWLLQVYNSSREVVEGKMLISSLQWPVTGHEKMEWNCVRGHLDGVWGQGSSPRRWSVTETGFPGKQSWHQAWQSSGNLCMTLLVTWFTLGPVRSSELVLMILIGFVPTWDSLWFYKSSTCFCSCTSHLEQGFADTQSRALWVPRCRQLCIKIKIT